MCACEPLDDRPVERPPGPLGHPVVPTCHRLHEQWPRLVQAARFEEMRARADQLAPDPVGILKDRAAFFRRGSSGAGRELLSSDELARYRDRTEPMGPRDLLAWLHREDHPLP